MLCPHDASCTMSADVLCHNPPGPARGDGLLAKAQTSAPARSREAFPLRHGGLCSLKPRARPCSRQAADELRIGTAV
jgi:hypothetical protein